MAKARARAMGPHRSDHAKVRRTSVDRRKRGQEQARAAPANRPRHDGRDGRSHLKRDES